MSPLRDLPREMLLRYGSTDPQEALRRLYLDRHRGWTTGEARGLYLSQLRWVQRVAAAGRKHRYVIDDWWNENG